MNQLKRVMVIVGCLLALAGGCVPDPSKRDVAGPYQTWDDVIKRWIGGNTTDLYLELGPPNLHPHERDDGMIEMVWDFSIDRMPGQADYYNLLPLYGGGVNCQIHFIANKDGIVQEGRRVGCD